MKTKILTVIFTDVYMQPFDIPKLRGYFSRKFSEYTELHNHLPDGKFSYGFPQVQYRIVERHPALIGFNKGIEVLKKIFFELDEMIINGRRYSLFEKEIFLKETNFGMSDNFIDYKFISPWMALNEENYKHYQKANKFERQKLLKKILRGNLITLSKGFGYTIPNIDEIKTDGFFRPKQVNFKNIKMLCFTGEFMVNFHIPDFLGLGKQSARGFGVVRHSEVD
ncbi:MAG: hypothetical protein B6D62_03250 [Candidatus Cloacimonas sp. 4484_275]|nr:MAG: hypothetical protein B6D62_03250 [Candidatus Cloacimonas sp. 4484_275]